MKRGFLVLQCLLELFLLLGCRTGPRLPPADLQALDWSVRQGQAVWTASAGQEGVAVEVLLATREGGGCFVQFAKPPFTLATARAEDGGWRVELPMTRRKSSGRGPGPERLVWFALAEEIRGRPAGGGWHFESRDGAAWRLTNFLTGEALEGYLSP